MIVAGRFLAKARLPWALACVLVSVVFEAQRYPSAPPPLPTLLLPVAERVLETAAATAQSPRLAWASGGEIPAPAGAPSAHASALVAGPQGELRAYWWAGAHESAPDVAIYTARYTNGRWSAARRVLTREGLAAQLGFGVRRLGNPSVWRAPDGRLHLWVVATGLGGWAASRVVQLVSTDDESFRALRVLPLTPLWNTSVLVRTPPVALVDGGWLLPAYFELGTKYPLLVSFDAKGRPRSMRRIGRSTTSLQPSLLPLSATALRAWMRDHGAQARLQRALSLDGGQTWRDEPAPPIVNHDSSIATLRLHSGGCVMLHNDQAPAPATPRQWLRLSTSADGERWSAGPDVRLGAPGDEFSYPAALQIGNQLHVTYTLQRRSIGHSVFNLVPAGAREVVP